MITYHRIHGNRVNFGVCRELWYLPWFFTCAALKFLM